jgi:hypothetical protein
LARTTIATPGFLDRLGDRVVVTDRTGGDLEVLRLRPEITAVAEFEASLKARAEQLSGFQHRSVARVRGVSRLAGGDGRLAVVSDVAKGWRLSEVLQATEHEGHLIHTSTVLFLLRQIAAVLTPLQATGAGIAHGALGPERVLLTPAGRVLVVEYILGSALEHLPALPPDRMWKEFRLAIPPDADPQRFGPHTDVLQLGIIALSLVHNRLLRRDEYPGRLVELLDSATESVLTGARQPIGRALRDWLEQALGLVAGKPRWTMEDAQRGLEWIVSKDGGYFSTPVGLEPLLQSVDLFFTVPAGDVEETEPAQLAPAAHEPATTAPPAPVPRPAAPAAIAAAVPVVAPPVASAAPAPPPPAVAAAPLAVPAPIVAPAQVMASPIVSVPATRSSAAPALLHQATEPELSPATTTRLLTLVKPVEEAPKSLPPATELIGRLDAEDGPAASELRDRADEPLVVNSSPLAEFAGEHTTDELPEAQEIPRDVTPAPRPPLRPVPPPRPTPGADNGPAPEVGPVADMLSVDRQSPRRRSGWNNEAWLSHSGDRQSGTSRPAASASGAAPRAQKSGATPVASGAHAAADAPKPAASPEPAEPASGTPRTADAPHSSGSGSLFGYASTEGSEESDLAAPAASNRKIPLIAAAAVVILCVGGFAAWSALKPSAPAAAGDRAARVEKPASPVSSPAAADAARPAPESARTAPPAAPPAAAAPAEAKPVTGSVQFVSAIPASVSEKGSAVGTTAAAFTLPAGRHVLELSSAEYGYQAVREVDVRPNRLTRVELVLPKGAVNINATPWAEVFVDGQRVGETPLGNVPMTVGSHEVKFRHPQLGEQVRTVVVTSGVPGRLSVDMKQ